MRVYSKLLLLLLLLDVRTSTGLFFNWLVYESPWCLTSQVCMWHQYVNSCNGYSKEYTVYIWILLYIYSHLETCNIDYSFAICT